VAARHAKEVCHGQCNGEQNQHCLPPVRLRHDPRKVQKTHQTRAIPVGVLRRVWGGTSSGARPGRMPTAVLAKGLVAACGCEWRRDAALATALSFHTTPRPASAQRWRELDYGNRLNGLGLPARAEV